jgi:hypothetical protein
MGGSFASSFSVQHAVVNGKLGSGFGQLFEADVNSSSGTVMAA